MSLDGFTVTYTEQSRSGHYLVRGRTDDGTPFQVTITGSEYQTYGVHAAVRAHLHDVASRRMVPR